MCLKFILLDGSYLTGYEYGLDRDENGKLVYIVDDYRIIPVADVEKITFDIEEA